AIFNQQPMGFYNLETLKEDARRHGIAVLNPDINRSEEKCTTDSSCSENTPCPDSSGPLHRPCSVGATHRGCPSLRLGFLSVNGIGEAAAKAIVETRNSKGPFCSLADVMERTGLIQARVENLISAGALDCFNSDRRAARWESGLRYRPRGRWEVRSEKWGGKPTPHISPTTTHLPLLTGYQLALSLPIEQDMAELPELTAWQRMKGEYCSMGLFPGGHIMASLRRYLKGMATSRDILNLEDGDEVKTAGIVVRRQHPLAKAYFLTLEDEFGHISLLVWPGVYEHFKHTIREPFLIVRGTVSRREGTLEVVVNHVRTKAGLSAVPKSKDWC
ncbi:MAG: OB-fold nucleic acid binding domain-containing protein, partial [Dehalococcoidia bacterium]|nr:OB-fold nucleic acid binding domain-containing protein [Dehalococcoidia bacterium]